MARRSIQENNKKSFQIIKSYVLTEPRVFRENEPRVDIM